MKYDSFSLANIVPQNPINNRTTWRKLEANTRYLAVQYQDIYVVTGLTFLGNPIKQLNQHIMVPTHLYKAIYIPSLQKAGVYFVPNDDSQRIEVISLDELATRTGIKVMPGLPASVTQATLALPINATANKTIDSFKTKNISPSLSIFQLISLLLQAIAQWLLSLFQH